MYQSFNIRKTINFLRYLLIILKRVYCLAFMSTYTLFAIGELAAAGFTGLRQYRLYPYLQGGRVGKQIYEQIVNFLLTICKSRKRL